MQPILQILASGQSDGGRNKLPNAGREDVNKETSAFFEFLSEFDGELETLVSVSTGTVPVETRSLLKESDFPIAARESDRELLGRNDTAPDAPDILQLNPPEQFSADYVDLDAVAGSEAPPVSTLIDSYPQDIEVSKGDLNDTPLPDTLVDLSDAEPSLGSMPVSENAALDEQPLLVPQSELVRAPEFRDTIQIENESEALEVVEPSIEIRDSVELPAYESVGVVVPENKTTFTEKGRTDTPKEVAFVPTDLAVQVTNRKNDEETPKSLEERIATANLPLNAEAKHPPANSKEFGQQLPVPGVPIQARQVSDPETGRLPGTPTKTPDLGREPTINGLPIGSEPKSGGTNQPFVASPSSFELGGTQLRETQHTLPERVSDILVSGPDNRGDPGPMDRTRSDPAAARTIVNQIVQSIVRAPGEAFFEIRLQPEELGRVRLSITPVEAGVSVQITAERSETLDLLRRHIELLEDDLQDSGFENLQFTFGSESSEQEEKRSDADHSAEMAKMPNEARILEVELVQQEKTTSSGRLDIRV